MTRWLLDGRGSRHSPVRSVLWGTMKSCGGKVEAKVEATSVVSSGLRFPFNTTHITAPCFYSLPTLIFSHIILPVSDRHRRLSALSGSLHADLLKAERYSRVPILHSLGLRRHLAHPHLDAHESIVSQRALIANRKENMARYFWKLRGHLCTRLPASVPG